MILAEETVSVDLPLSVLHVSLPAFVSTSACSGLTRMIHLKNVSLFGMTSAFPVRGEKIKKITFNMRRWVWAGCESICRGSETPTDSLQKCQTMHRRQLGSLGRSGPLSGRESLLQIQLRMRWFLLLPVVQTVFDYESTVLTECPTSSGRLSTWPSGPVIPCSRILRCSCTHHIKKCGWKQKPRAVFPCDVEFPSKDDIITRHCLRDKVTYLSHNVSVLGVHLSDCSQVSDHTEHLVHLQEDTVTTPDLQTWILFFPLKTAYTRRVVPTQFNRGGNRLTTQHKILKDKISVQYAFNCAIFSPFVQPNLARVTLLWLCWPTSQDRRHLAPSSGLKIGWFLNSNTQKNCPYLQHFKDLRDKIWLFNVSELTQHLLSILIWCLWWLLLKKKKNCSCLELVVTWTDLLPSYAHTFKLMQ